MSRRHARLLASWVCLALAACDDRVQEFLLGPSSDEPLVEQAPAPEPIPTAMPAPSPEPAATPEPTPTPCQDRICNSNPVARVNAKVYFLEITPGIPEPGTVHASEAPVGCRIHFDCTPRDAANRETRARGEPYWTFAPEGLVSGGNRADYTPAVYAERPGQLSVWCHVDGVTSEEVRIRVVGY